MNNSIVKNIATSLLLVFAMTQMAVSLNAQNTLVWNDSNGGIFDVETSWTPIGVPEALDTAQFNSLNTDTIAVTFYENEVIETLEFVGGRYQFFGAGQFGVGPKVLVTNNLSMENSGNLLLQHGLDDRSFRLNVTNNFDSAGRIVVAEGTALMTVDAILDSLISNSPGEVALVGYDPAGNQSIWAARNVTIGESRFGNVTANSGTRIEFESAVMASEIGGDGKISLEGKGFNANPTSARVDDLLVVGQMGNGLVNVSDGAELSSQTTYIASEPGSTGSMVLSGIAFDHLGTFINSGNVYVGGSDVQSGGNGELRILSRGTAEITNTLKIWENGSVLMENQGSLTVDLIDNSQGGEFNFFSGTLVVNHFLGDLVNQAGTVLPGGDETGALSIFGNYTQLGESKLIMDLAGNTPGVDHDFINLSGIAFVDGQLAIKLQPGFQPAPSDQFTILGAANVIGFFDNALNGQRVDVTDGSGSFVVNYGIGSPFDSNLIVLSDYVPNVLIGDVNGDGLINLLDVNPFVNAVTNGVFVAAADINQDGEVNLLDVQPFVNLLTSV